MQNRQIPDWLKNLQENSWELELLISGGAIFSLFQFTNVFLDWITKTSTYLPGIVLLIFFGMLAIKILTLGFMIHLSLRAYWLALVCINYVYPEGINFKKINWKKPFTINTKDGADLQEQITKVDKQCGTVMFMSITSVFAIVGISLIIGLFFTFVASVESTKLSETIFSVTAIYLIAYLIDLLSFGLLRKIPYFSYLLFPFFKIFDIISLRRIYQQSLWMFNTNVKKLRFVLSALVFSGFAVFLTYLSIYDTMHFPNVFDKREYNNQMAKNDDLNFKNYMDEWEEDKSYDLGIDSKFQQSNYLELFVAYKKTHDDAIKHSSKLNKLKSFDKIIKVELDSLVLDNLIWFPSYKKNKTDGISTMISIDSLKNGQHTLVVYTGLIFKVSKGEYNPGISTMTIPFWVDKN